MPIYFKPRDEPRLELGVHIFGIMSILFWNSLDNAYSSIVFYLEMKVEVGVHGIRSRFTPRFELMLVASNKSSD